MCTEFIENNIISFLGIEDGLQSTTEINYWLCGPAVGFIVAYWTLCLLTMNNIMFRWDSFNCCCCCHHIIRRKKNEKSATATAAAATTMRSDNDESEMKISEVDTTQVSVIVSASGGDDSGIRRRPSFVKRDKTLQSVLSSKKSHAGHMRTLFADGPEFIGLTEEVHSINGGLGRLENMLEMLIEKKKEEEKEEEEEETRLEKMIATLKGEVDTVESEKAEPFEEIETSSEDEESSGKKLKLDELS